MALTDYTTYPSIRAVLGVATAEIRDTVLALPLYENALTLDLMTLNPTLITQYETIKVIDPSARTALQARFFNLVQLYAAYAVSVQLLGSAEMFAPKKITDGAASMERNVDAWATLRDAVSLAYSRMRGQLLALLEEVDPTQPVPVLTTRRYVSAVALGTDPVTGA